MQQPDNPQASSFETPGHPDASSRAQSAKRPEITSAHRFSGTSVGTVVAKRPLDVETQDESPASRYRIRPDEFLEITSSDDRDSLRHQLISALTACLDRESAIYLEGLGILFPHMEVKQRTRTLREKFLVHNDTVRSVRFEKCSELIPYHWEKFGRIVETRELVHSVYAELPLALKTRWTESEFRSIVRGYLSLVRREIVRRGFSHELSPVVDFFALHNRQGRTENDWFAGADIFVQPRYEQTLFIEPCVIKQRPCLESGWELLEAAFGKPCRIMTLDLVRELSNLGYDPRALDDAADVNMRSIPVAVFERPGTPHSLVYCTDGLRLLSRPAPETKEVRPGNELVFQLSLPPGEASCNEAAEIPDWPLRPLTMGWILMQSARSKTIRCGAGLSCDVPLIPDSDTELRSIFATSFSCVRHEQLCLDRPFSYVNLIGITADEAAVAARYSPEFLLRLLEHRDLDQCTKPGRSSIVAKTGLLDAVPVAAAARTENTQILPNA